MAEYAPVVLGLWLSSNTQIKNKGVFVMPICDIINAIFTLLINDLGLSFLGPLADFLWELANCIS